MLRMKEETFNIHLYILYMNITHEEEVTMVLLLFQIFFSKLVTFIFQAVLYKKII